MSRVRQSHDDGGKMAGATSNAALHAALGAWVRAVVRWRWGVLVLALAVMAGALWGTVRHLGIATDTVDMISPEEPFRQHAKAFNAAFPHLDDTILAVVAAPTPERAEIMAEALAARLGPDAPGIASVALPGAGFLKTHGLLYLKPAALADTLDQLAGAAPLMARLDQDPNLRGLAAILGDAADQGRAEQGGNATLTGLDRLLDEMAATAEAQAAGQARKVSWQGLMAADNGDAEADSRFARTQRFVLVRPEMDYSRLKPAATGLATVQEATAAVLQAQDGAGRIRLTGKAVIAHEELETVEQGGKLAGLLSLAAVSVILVAGFRRLRVVAACLVTLLAGLVWTAGVATLVVGKLNLLSVAFAVLFVGLGIDFCIHFALRYREAQRQAATEALVTAGQGVGGALLLSALCAALGFFAFLPTAYLGLAELGLIAGLGMFVAVFASLTLLPALLAVLWVRRPGGESAAAAQQRRGWLLAYRRPVLAAAVVAAALGAVLAPRMVFDFNPINLRDPDAASVQTFQALARDVETTPYAVNVLAEDLDAARNLRTRFGADPAFGSVRILDSFIPKDQDEKRALLADAGFFLAPILAPESGTAADASLSVEARQAAFAEIVAALTRLDESGGAVAAAAGRVRAALDDLGTAPDLAVSDLAALADRWTGYLPRTLSFLRAALTVEAVTRADLPADLTAQWIAADGRARVEARPAAPLTDNAAIRDFAEAAQAVTPRATGAPVVIHEASNAVVAAFGEATGYAAGAILLVLALALRRVTDVLLALAPLVLAILLTLATAVLAGIPLNFANVIVLPLLMGLGVSSGIHLVLRVRRSGSVASVLGSSTPRAVLLSVLTTLASFGTLMVSAHRGMSSMGSLLTLAVAFTLLSVLVVLPCLLAEVQARRPASGEASL